MSPKIAIQGIAGANTDNVAQNFCPNAEMLYCDHFHEAFNAVSSGEADYCILPIWNVIAGDVRDTVTLMNQLEDHDMRRACMDIQHEIKHCLMGMPGATLKKIDNVFSHEMALKQCGKFIGEHLPLAQRSGNDTAEAAKYIADIKADNAGAIADRRAAELYGLEVIAEDIADEPYNYTIFAVLERKPS